jgi:hypothetical protein
MDAFGLPPPLWHSLKQKLKPSEELEVKRILGWADVEHNEDLHQEASQLVEILQEYRERIDSQEERCVQRRMQLARDPEWEFLQSEIATFVSALRNRDSDQLAPQKMPNRLAAASPAFQTRPLSACEQRPASPASQAAVTVHTLSLHTAVPVQVSRLDVRRPSSSCGRPGTSSSSAASSSRSRADTSRSHASAAAGDDDVLDSVACLSIETVESCASSLQLRLRREADNLMQNIAILHLALEDEREREDAVLTVPSLEQLRTTSSQLQAEFVSRASHDGSGFEANEPVARGRLRPRRA